MLQLALFVSLFGVSSLWAPTAKAQKAVPSATGVTPEEESDQKPTTVGGMVSEGVETGVETTKYAVTRPWQWLALDLGLASLSTTSPFEVNKQGSFFSLKTLVMFDFDYFVLEGGVGLFSASLSGDVRGGQQTAKVTTTLTEAGARWVINSSWQLGGFAQWIFGKETDFGPLAGANTNNLIVGAQVAVEPDWFERARGRVTLSYLFDKTIKTRNFTAVTIGFQGGLPWLDDEGRWMWDSGSSSTK